MDDGGATAFPRGWVAVAVHEDPVEAELDVARLVGGGVPARTYVVNEDLRERTGMYPVPRPAANRTHVLVSTGHRRRADELLEQADRLPPEFRTPEIERWADEHEGRAGRRRERTRRRVIAGIVVLFVAVVVLLLIALVTTLTK